MSAQEIEDVRSRTIRPKIELRLLPSPGRISADRSAEIGANFELRNVSAATAAFAVVTLGLGRRANAEFLERSEWHCERPDNKWKIARTVIASGTSARWSPITPGFSLTLQAFTLRVGVRDPDFAGPPSGIGLIRRDSDGGATIHRLPLTAAYPERSMLRLDPFEGADDPYLQTVEDAPELFMSS